uniref:Membrane associated ring n=1 Tax=Tetraselmis sp. GSL018 TaxID=582737 RepID=A0A061SD69_9CHLO
MALETNSDILENECTEKYMCRICFEETTEVGELVSPCKCTGTQKYVHLKCLRRWQENVLRNSRSLDGYDERAIKCSVCRTPFSIPPPVVAWQQRLSAILRGISSALCISLFAFGLSGECGQTLRQVLTAKRTRLSPCGSPVGNLDRAAFGPCHPHPRSPISVPPRTALPSRFSRGFHG